MDQNFFDELKMTYGINLNEQQMEAVRHGDGPCLLLAVPGAGKTTTLLCRLAYLVKEKQVKPEEILSMTFSRASAKDMSQRYESLFRGTLDSAVRFSTIHSFAYGVVMNYNRRFSANWKLIEGADDSQWSKSRLLCTTYYQVNHEHLNEGDYEQLSNDLSYVKNTMMKRAEVEAYRSPVSNFTEIYERYERTKKENRLMDFDDMLVHCYKILLNQPSVLEAYQERYRYIQLDEAQDTSKLQHEIIALLAKKHQNIFYVADDDQSIYGFRGAKPSYLFGMDQIYDHMKILRMEQNYRSTQQIVAVSNRFIKTNQHRYDKELFTRNGEGSRIELIKVPKRKDQYKSLAGILETVSNHKEIGILYRNNFSAVSLVYHFEKLGIPYNLRGYTKKYFDHWIINDLLHMMEFAYYPMSVDRFKGFYYKLKGYYISKAMLENAYMGYDQDTVFDRIIDNCDLPVYQQNNVIRLRDDFAYVKASKPTDAIEYILTEMGYLEFLVDRCGRAIGTFDGYNRMIEALKALAEDTKDVDDLRANIAALEEAMTAAAARHVPEGLTMTTAHSSKGLEWKSVYMIDLIDGVFPSKDVGNRADAHEIEEERRLFYVGMTRAKDQLTVYETTNLVPSMFLEELKALM